MSNSTVIDLSFLVGLPFHDAGRAAHMKKLSFGEQYFSAKHKNRLVGKWELHLSCAWLLSAGSQILVSNADIYVPVDEERLTWDQKGGNQCDVRCWKFFEGAGDLVVTDQAVFPSGGFRLQLSNGAQFEVWPDTWQEEQWVVYLPANPSEMLFSDVVDGTAVVRWLKKPNERT